MKIAFLDRDGTINIDYPDSDWKNNTTPELMPNAINGIKGLINLGYKIIIITNQYIINDGIITTEEYQEFTKNLVNILKDNSIELLDIFYCPHNDNDNCSCMKPKVGMIQQAVSTYPTINLQDSIVIGDSLSDKQMAESLNIDFYGINGKDFDNNYDSIHDVYLKFIANKEG